MNSVRLTDENRGLTSSSLASMYLFIVIFTFCIFYVGSIQAEEPHCLSKYDYDYKMMQKVFDLEQKLRQTMDTLSDQNKLIERMSKEDSGSIYTRWGRNVCDGDAKVVYTGYAAGKKYNDKGSGGDTICLPANPSWLKYKDGKQGSRGHIYGTEIDSNDVNDVFEYSVLNQDLPCAVCSTQRRVVLMIPGSSKCFDRWIIEYQGYLMTAYNDHPGPYNHVCVDSRPEFIPNGSGNDDQHTLYFTEVRCGSLPCPPYVEGRELACVVCSK